MRTHPEPTFLHEGKFVCDMKDAATAFAKYVATVYTYAQKKKKHPRINVTPNNVLSLINITVSEVEAAIKKLSCSMAVGPDNMGLLIMETYGQIPSPTLATIFNKSIKPSRFPDSYKRLCVAPV